MPLLPLVERPPPSFQPTRPITNPLNPQDQSPYFNNHLGLTTTTTHCSNHLSSNSPTTPTNNIDTTPLPSHTSAPITANQRNTPSPPFRSHFPPACYTASNTDAAHNISDTSQPSTCSVCGTRDTDTPSLFSSSHQFRPTLSPNLFNIPPSPPHLLTNTFHLALTSSSPHRPPLPDLPPVPTVPSLPTFHGQLHTHYQPAATTPIIPPLVIQTSPLPHTNISSSPSPSQFLGNLSPSPPIIPIRSKSPCSSTDQSACPGVNQV